MAHSQAPSLISLMKEMPNAGIEIATLMMQMPWLLATSPKAEKRTPVLLLPGYMASEGAMRVMAFYLDRLGYQTYNWGLGRNREPRSMRINRIEKAAAYRDFMAERVVKRIDQIHADTGEPVTMIGWSLGGCIGLDATRHTDGKVNTLITLGSPFGDPRGVSIWKIMRRVVKSRIRMEDQDFNLWLDRTKLPDNAPNIKVLYSLYDGIVGQSIAKLPDHPSVEHVEVDSSHVGFAMNVNVYRQIADILASLTEKAPPEETGHETLTV